MRLKRESGNQGGITRPNWDSRMPSSTHKAEADEQFPPWTPSEWGKKRRRGNHVDQEAKASNLRHGARKSNENWKTRSVAEALEPQNLPRQFQAYCEKSGMGSAMKTHDSQNDDQQEQDPNLVASKALKLLMAGDVEGYAKLEQEKERLLQRLKSNAVQEESTSSSKLEMTQTESEAVRFSEDVNKESRDVPPIDASASRSTRRIERSGKVERLAPDEVQKGLA